MMPRKAKNRPPSLLDSKQYQSALKVNQIESNKLDKLKNSVESNRKRNIFMLLQKLQLRKEIEPPTFWRPLNTTLIDWTNTQQWLLDIKSNSGYADLEKYNKVFMEDDEKSVGEVPTYYFMYGIRIGERPQLLKNFLGRKAKPKKPLDAGTKRNKKEKVLKGFLTSKKDSEDNISDKEGEKLSHNQIIIDGQVVTQLPIGYFQQCARLSQSFANCTSKELIKKRSEKPLYYTQKHRYIIPPPNMFAKEYLNDNS